MNQAKTTKIIIPKQGRLEIALGAILISFAAVCVRYTHTSPLVDGFYRMFFGGTGLIFIALVSGQSLKIKSKPALKFIFLAGLFFALDLSFWHRSIDKIGPGLATVIVNLQVFVLTLLGVLFYKEKIGWKYFLALPLAALGLYFLVGHSWNALSENYNLAFMNTSLLPYGILFISPRCVPPNKFHNLWHLSQI